MLTSALLVAILILVVAQVADVITTMRALSLPGTKEGNPFVRFLQRYLGDVWWIGKVTPSIVAVGAAYALGGAWAAIILCVVASVITLWVAKRNHDLYQKLR